MARAQVGVNQRRVTLRPAPETMTYLTALLPLTEGVACLAALDRAANTTRATGDPTGQSRTRSQVMADELITRITGINPATDGMPVEIHLVIDPDTLLGDHHHDSADPDDHESHESHGSHGSDDPGSDESHGSDDPAARAEKPAAGSRGCSLPEYGPIPAPLGRLLARTGSTRDPHTGTGGGPTAAQQAWVRRLFTAPDGTVTGQDTRRRFFTGALRELIIARDQTCRTPWCEAPIRHIDHITPHADGGPTTPDNGNGLCEACNYTKDAPGWHANATTDHHGTHTTTITTPTGHTYTSRPPPALNPTLPAPPDTDTG